MVEIVVLKIEGVPEKDLKMSIEKLGEFQKWAAEEKVDRWTIRAALLMALDEDSEHYFLDSGGTFREVAAFDNGVGSALRSAKSRQD